MSSSLSKSANFQWMQRRRESWMFTRRHAVKSGPTWRIHGKQKTVATVAGKTVVTWSEEGEKKLEQTRWKKERREMKRIEGREKERERGQEEEKEEEEEESGFESLPTTRRDTCGRENLLCLWKARKWRGLLSPGTRSLPRTCRKVRVKPLLHPFVPPRHAPHTTKPLVRDEGVKVYLLLVAGERKTDRGNRWLRDFKKMLGTRFAIPKI